MTDMPPPQPMHSPQSEPPKQGMSTAVKVLLGLVGLMVLGCMGCGAVLMLAGSAADTVAQQRDDDEALVEDNAKITNCEVGEFNTAVATVEFTNPLDEEKGYIAIEVNFLDGDTVVGSGTATFENLSPSQKAVGEATAFDLAEGTTNVSCEVVDGTIL